jgi:hypothetical protein
MALTRAGPPSRVMARISTWPTVTRRDLGRRDAAHLLEGGQHHRQHRRLDQIQIQADRAHVPSGQRRTARPAAICRATSPAARARHSAWARPCPRRRRAPRPRDRRAAPAHRQHAHRQPAAGPPLAGAAHRPSSVTVPDTSSAALARLRVAMVLGLGLVDRAERGASAFTRPRPGPGSGPGWPRAGRPPPAPSARRRRGGHRGGAAGLVDLAAELPVVDVGVDQQAHPAPLLGLLEDAVARGL